MTVQNGQRLGIYAAFVLVVGLSVWGLMGLTRHAIITIDRVGDAAQGITEITAHINAKNGTIAMADEDLGAVKSVVIHADLVARHEQQSLTAFDARGLQLFNNVNGAVTDTRTLINAGTSTLNQTTVTLAAVQPVLSNADGAVTDIRETIPELKRAMSNTADLTGHANGAVTHVEGITGDFQVKLHPMLNPEPCKTKMCTVKRDLSALKSAGGGAEGLYYLIEVWRDIF